MQPYYESEPRTITYYSKNIVGKSKRNFSHSIGTNFEKEVLMNEANVIVEFFKPTCPSCLVLSSSFEEFAKVVKEIQEYVQAMESGKIEHKKYEDNILKKYHVEHPEKFKNLVIGRYNIYNEVFLH